MESRREFLAKFQGAHTGETPAVQAKPAAMEGVQGEGGRVATTASMEEDSLTTVALEPPTKVARGRRKRSAASDDASGDAGGDGGSSGGTQQFPVLASACPGWICLAEKKHGDFILPYIST